MNKRIRLVVLAGLALSTPATLQAQDGRDWTVALRGGGQLYNEASALKTGAVVGLEAMYRLTSRISIGPALDYVTGKSDERFFVGVLDFGVDSSRVFEVGQNVSVLHYGGDVLFNITSSRIAPYLAVGGGGYTVYMSAQSNDVAKRMSGPMLRAGGGLRITLTEAAGLQLDARDMVYMDFDRTQLNPIRPQHRNGQVQPDGTIVYRFPGAEHTDLPDVEETLHNIRLTLAFQYIPGMNR